MPPPVRRTPSVVSISEWRQSDKQSEKETNRRPHCLECEKQMVKKKKQRTNFQPKQPLGLPHEICRKGVHCVIWITLFIFFPFNCAIRCVSIIGIWHQAKQPMWICKPGRVLACDLAGCFSALGFLIHIHTFARGRLPGFAALKGLLSVHERPRSHNFSEKRQS